MRMRPYFVLLLVLALTNFACQQQERELTVAEREGVENDVRKTLESYLDAIRTGGLLAEFAYLDSSTDFFWVPPGYTSALSYDSVASVLRENAGMFSTMDYRWETLKINPLHTTLAAYTGKLHCISIDTAGNRSEYQMLETGTVIKRPDGWKILCGQSRVME